MKYISIFVLVSLSHTAAGSVLIRFTDTFYTPDEDDGEDKSCCVPPHHTCNVSYNVASEAHGDFA